MSAYKTEEKEKREVIDMMGEDLGLLYHSLWRELLWVNMKWGVYVELYGKKPSRIELLNRAASRFFWIIQEILWEDTLLHIARLVDPPKSYNKKDNLTIRRLPDLIKEESFKDELSKLIKIAVDKSDFCKDWRNRHIAHRDLRLALEKGDNPLLKGSRAKVREVLSSFSDVLNAVSVYYMKKETMFADNGEPGDAVSLLQILSEGLRVEEEKNERLKAGIFREEDFQSPDI